MHFTQVLYQTTLIHLSMAMVCPTYPTWGVVGGYVGLIKSYDYNFVLHGWGGGPGEVQLAIFCASKLAMEQSR